MSLMPSAGSAMTTGLAGWRSSLAIGVASALCASMAWLIGFGTALHLVPPARPVARRAPAEFRRFDEVWNIVEAEFFGRLPLPTDIASAAIEGLVGGLDDPYAAYIDRGKAAAARADYAETVAEGLGAWIEAVSDGAMILSTLPDSPARRAGLVPGDRLLSAKGRSLVGMTRSELLAALDGPAGSSAVLTVRSEGGLAPRTVELVRARFTPPGIELRRPAEGIGYLHIARLEPAMLEELDSALAGLPELGARGLVIDLRDNPGGELISTRRVAGRFFGGEAWRQIDRQGRVLRQMAEPGDLPAPKLPPRVAVLINSGTASAAEMLAGGLRDRLGARLFGSPSFGKGTIQGIVGISDGSAMRLTVARWETPSGYDVGGRGLLPDLRIDAPTRFGRSHGTPSPRPITDDADPVLAAALAWLRGPDSDAEGA